MKAWVAYSLLRVGLFAVVFAVLMLIGIEWWLSAIIAAVIGLCVAYIFFGKLRYAVATDIADRRARAGERDDDAVAEDDDAPENTVTDSTGSNGADNAR